MVEPTDQQLEQLFGEWAGRVKIGPVVRIRKGPNDKGDKEYRSFSLNFIGGTDETDGEGDHTEDTGEGAG